MSQEDLVKTNKKQLLFLQKLKAKCDDLQAKLAAQSDYDKVKVFHCSLPKTKNLHTCNSLTKFILLF